MPKSLDLISIRSAPPTDLVALLAAADSPDCSAVDSHILLDLTDTLGYTDYNLVVDSAADLVEAEVVHIPGARNSVVE